MRRRRRNKSKLPCKRWLLTVGRKLRGPDPLRPLKVDRCRLEFHFAFASAAAPANFHVRGWELVHQA
jgi:hypothetical protein